MAWDDNLEKGDNLMKHLSPTKIEGFLKCPKQVRLRYVEKVQELESGFLMSGNAVHAVLERALKRVILGGKIPDRNEADDWFLAAWDSEKKEREEKPRFIGWLWDEPEEKTKNECRALIPFALTEILPVIKPRLVEEEAKLYYDSEIGGFLVWGQLDLLEEDGVLSDWKTTKKVSKNARDSWLQLGHYSRYVHEVVGGSEVTPARKIFLIRGAAPKVDVVKYEITPAMRAYFSEVAAEVWKAVRANSYVPNTNGWWCDPDWCPFYGPCQGELK